MCSSSTFREGNCLNKTPESFSFCKVCLYKVCKVCQPYNINLTHYQSVLGSNVVTTIFSSELVAFLILKSCQFPCAKIIYIQSTETNLFASYRLPAMTKVFTKYTEQCASCKEDYVLKVPNKSNVLLFGTFWHISTRIISFLLNLF